MALQISGVGTLLTGINFVTTILKMRAPGMSYLRMPIFCWTALASNLLIIAAFPVLTATLAMLMLDRYLGFHFFTNDGGGNSMLYMNLIWVWGHPGGLHPGPAGVRHLFRGGRDLLRQAAVRLPLDGLRTMAICILSFMVWLHHFFTMGAGANINAFFGIMSMIIAIPTGVKIFNWLFTMYGGRVRFTVPMLWSLGFMCTFVIGGLTGVLLAIPPVDFVVHNSLFLVAHFHHVIIGGVVFGALAGYTYWFPKAFGFTLDERLGKAVFWCWFIGFHLAFMPLYCARPDGRDAAHAALCRYRLAAVVLVALVGALIILAGIVLTVVQLDRQDPRRASARDVTGDPWDGRTLEWLTASPPPHYNFAVLPDVHGEEAYWGMKQTAIKEAR